jgi:hypothetical protein
MNVINWRHKGYYPPTNIINWRRSLIASTTGHGKSYGGKHRWLLARLIAEQEEARRKSVLDGMEKIKLVSMHEMLLKQREEWIERRAFEKSSLLAIILEESI